ncbi:uncharacterized protein LOC120343380 [Styela clava]|uniref:uncharacterized protein LOC120343380 n=1 Tax=Styela clava TaxID=7725 RepID=UPI001939A625|nr:uncharacterized protein LOC120343380 [Styela clava]
MKVAIFIAIVFAGIVNGQIVRHENALTWPENDHTLGGAIVDFVYEEIGNGSCQVSLPSMVNLFHVVNGFIVPESSSPVEGLYTISAPTHWSLVNGTFKVLILFDRGSAFALEDIVFACDPLAISDINVYSFPQNNLMGEASSTICYRRAFHVGDVLTITFPVRVREFNVTTWNSNYELTTEDNITYTLTGFQAPIGNDFNTEVSFHLVYDMEDGVDRWFSAGDITVSITKAADSEVIIV